MPTRQVIVGGGPAATNAIEEIRDFDQGKSQITLISDEPAHSRMALPYWLAGKIPQEHTHTADDQYFKQHGVQTRIGQRVTKVDPGSNAVTLDDGSTLEYDNLLIATGASPLTPAIPGADLPGVQPMWTLAHTAAALDTTAKIKRPQAVLVGAGFIGFIELNAMFKRDWQLTVVEREQQVLPRMLDADSAAVVADWLQSIGVGVHTGTTVTAISAPGQGRKMVQLEDGSSLEADLVVLATGIQPNLQLIDSSGIDTDDGILVNDRLQTNIPNIYAAGDVAQGPVLFGKRPEIHAIHPTAVDHGRVAGANMAGHEVHYPGSLLMNVVDVCGLQCVSFGNWNDARAEVMTISNPSHHIYRKLLWTGDKMTGAIFTGGSNDVGMLTDVGMVKGILQTQTPLGDWKQFLSENPFDIRRAYIGAGVAQKLVGKTLTGKPSAPRQFRFKGAQPLASVGSSHAVYVGSKKN